MSRRALRRFDAALVTAVAAFALACGVGQVVVNNGDLEPVDPREPPAPCSEGEVVALFERSSAQLGRELILACGPASATAPAPAPLPADARRLGDVDRASEDWIAAARRLCRDQGTDVGVLSIVGTHSRLPGPTYADPAWDGELFFADASFCGTGHLDGPPVRRILDVAWSPDAERTPDPVHAVSSPEWDFAERIEAVERVVYVPRGDARPQDAAPAGTLQIELHGSDVRQTRYSARVGTKYHEVFDLDDARSFAAAGTPIFSGACFGGRTLAGDSPSSHVLVAAIEAGAPFAVGFTTVAWGSYGPPRVSLLLADLFHGEHRDGKAPAEALHAAREAFLRHPNVELTPDVPGLDITTKDRVTAASVTLYEPVPGDWRSEAP